MFRRIASLLSRPRVAGALVALLPVAVFANSAWNEYAMDDRSLVVGNPLTAELSGIPDLWRSDYWAPDIVSGLYRPLVMTTYALNRAAWGLDPLGYHVTNIVMMGFMSWLVWLLFRRLTDDHAVSLGGALLFGSLAVHAEVVANTAFGRPELMAGSFFLGTLLCHIQREEDAARRPWLLYAGGLVFYLCGLLSKESAVTVLGVIGLYDVLWRSDAAAPLWRRVVETFRRNFLRSYVGYFVVSALYLALRWWALSEQKTIPPEISLDNPLVGVEQPWRSFNALAVMLKYIGLMIFPGRLSHDYSYNEIPLFTDIRDPSWIPALIGCVLIAGLTVWSYRKSRVAFFGIGFFFLTFSVVSNVFVLIGTILGERLIFLPSIGFCLAAAVGIRELARVALRRREWAGAVFAGVLVVALVGNGARAMIRNLDFKNGRTLYLADVEGSNSAKTYNNAAAIYTEMKQYEKALELYRKAIEIKPYGYPTPMITAGYILTTLGRDEEAVEMYRAAIRNGATDAAVRNNLGFILADREIDVREGILLIEAAVKEFPRVPEFRDSLGWAYYKAGRLKGAVKQLELSLEITSEGPQADEARRHLEIVRQALAATRPSPDDPVANPTGG